MGLFGALFAGVSGLSSQSNKIGIISNNISNVNTVGYKESSAAFNTLVVPSGTTTFSPGGVISNTQNLINKQGLIQGTSSSTDLAISGNGFFAVNSNSDITKGQLLYSRSGSFTQDASGNFVNANGNFLLGWALDSSGNLINKTNSTDPTSLTSVKIQSNASGVATPTSTVAIAANLNASQAVLLGAGETVNFDPSSTYNYQNTAKNIIASNDYGAASRNLIKRGDQFSITSGGSPTSPYTFSYGGFAIGRNITDTTFAGNGDSSVTPTTFSSQSNPFTTTAGQVSGNGATITVTSPSAHNYVTGQVVNISGVSGAVDGIPAASINGAHTINVIDSTHYSFTATGTAFANQTTPFSIQTGITSGNTTTVTVTSPSANNYVTGQTVNISGVASPIDGISASQFNGNKVITRINATQYSFTVTNDGANFTSQTNPFAIQTGITSGNATTVTVTSPSAHGYTNGQSVAVSGVASAIDGIPASAFNGTKVINVIDATHYSFSVTNTGASFTNQNNPISTPSGVANGASTTVTVTSPSAHGYTSGQSVAVSGVSGTIDGISASQFNGTKVITVISPTQYSYTVTNDSGVATSGVASGGGASVAYSSVTTGATGGTGANYSSVTTGATGGTGATYSSVTAGIANTGGAGIGYTNITSTPKSFLNQTNSFTTAAGAVLAGGTVTVSVTTPSSHGYTTGQTIDIESVASTVDGIAASQFNGNHTITVTSPTTFTFTVTSTSGSAGGVTGGGTGINFANRTYPFAGNILDATTSSGAFLGTSTIAPFDPNALSFQIATSGTGTATFKYNTTGSPDTTQGQFNSLNTLIDAINNTTNLNARVVGGRLYVSANDANQGLTFINGQSGNTNNGKGIDWVNELGLSNVATAASVSPTLKRFDSLQTLSNQVNTIGAFTSTISNPLGAASIAINSSDPQQTIKFTDTTNINGSANYGSLLRELGFANNQGSPLTTVPPSSPNGFDTGTFTVKYDPNDSTKNMSGGKITPQFSRNITIYDSLGISHTVAFNVAKTGTNVWAAEITSVPATDVVSGSRTDGQLAAGTITFKGDGSISALGSQLTSNVNISWANGATTSSVALNLGTIAKTDGLSQFSAASNATSVSQNGSSSGQLTGISIDSSGYVISSFSNGQTQKTFKIPLVQINNPNGLESVSGNAFKQTQSSGTAVAVDAGTNGTGSIQASSLEQSTVDLSGQLTSLIVAQQAYGANSKLLTVADRLLQQLDQIIQ
ncbi:MAG: flagellar hook-basal body complex protein [Pseudomonadota bacterium]